eukprot:9246615-Alexandrium_andersonii.AAC.1
MHLTEGWTGKQANFFSPSSSVRRAAASELQAQYEAFKAASAQNDPFWKRVAGRSIFAHVSMKQLVNILRDADWGPTETLAEHCRNRLRCSMQTK